MAKLCLVRAVLILLVLCGVSSVAYTEPREMLIRVRSVDAKFIGSGVGGMKVLIEDAATGKLVDSGEISGGTGDTPALMEQGQTRGRLLAGSGAAGFHAHLDLERPTQVRVRVRGPLDVEQSVQEATLTTWVVPGRNLIDPGLVISLPGLIVDLVHQSVDGHSIDVAADVKLMCGCPITEGGLWDAADYQVVAQLRQGARLVAEAALEFTGTTNRFAGTIAAPAVGEYQLWIYGHAPTTGNTGAIQTRLMIE